MPGTGVISNYFLISSSVFVDDKLWLLTLAKEALLLDSTLESVARLSLELLLSGALYWSAALSSSSGITARWYRIANKEIF